MEMLNGGLTGWRDNEWVGRYFEHVADRFLKIDNCSVSLGTGTKIGKITLDAIGKSPYDFKVCSYDPKRKNYTSLNDFDSMIKVLEIFHNYNYIIALGTSVNSLAMNVWQDGIKKKEDGKLSTYSEKNKEMGVKSRVRKLSFTVDKIIHFDFNKESMKLCKETQKGWKNSNGNPRNLKFELPIDDPKIQPYITELVVFDNKESGTMNGLDNFI